jgi:hypothetical protein
MKKKTIALVILLVILSIILCGCMTEAEKVSHNVSKEADLFNVTRRVTVINARSDTPLLEIIGNLSVQHSSGDIDIIVEVGPGQYKKHFVRLNSWTIYVVEDISGAYVDKYHYEVNILPEMIIPITFTQDR